VLTGSLLARSRLVPRAIGLLLAASGPVYLVSSYLALLDAAAAASFEGAYLQVSSPIDSVSERARRITLRNAAKCRQIARRTPLPLSPKLAM
jgi:hypothetical protein